MRYKILGSIGFFLMLFALTSAIFFSYNRWYIYFVIGEAIFLGYINFICKNDSFLRNLLTKPKILLPPYLFFVFAAVLIDIIGITLLHLWNYPTFSVTDKIVHTYLIGYPFTFFAVGELFTLINTKIKSFLPTIIFTTIFAGFVHELPNTIMYEWQYTLPNRSIQLFQIDIVVLIGWIILIAVAVLGKKLLKEDLKRKYDKM